MADITKKDNNDLWTEMPPSGKQRMIEHQKATAPGPEEPDNKQKRNNRKADKDNKANKKKLKKERSPSSLRDHTQDRKPVKRGKEDSVPQFLGDSDTTEIPVAKPVDIQSRALKNKGRSNGEKKIRRHRHRISSYIIYIVLGIIALVVILGVLFTTVLFNLSGYEIIGDTVYSDDEVISATGANIGENLILMDKGAVKDRLIEALPYVDKVEISDDIINGKLIIKLNQAKSVANIQKNGVYYLVSENGRIMDAGLKTPDKNCVTVYGFDPEYASSGDFLSVADEKHRNMLSKLLSAVKQYDGIEDGNRYEAQKKYDALFELIAVCEETGLTAHIKSIDISNIYGIMLNYDNQLTLELGDVTDARLKLTVAKNLIDKGEFDGEKGTLILSGLADNSYNMKVTFRPEYDNTSNDETSDNNTPSQSVPQDTPADTDSEPEQDTESDTEPDAEPDIEPGYSTEPEE